MVKHTKPCGAPVWSGNSNPQEHSETHPLQCMCLGVFSVLTAHSQKQLTGLTNSPFFSLSATSRQIRPVLFGACAVVKPCTCKAENF